MSNDRGRSTINSKREKPALNHGDLDSFLSLFNDSSLKSSSDSAEVAELLSAAQEEIELDLRLGSHITADSSSLDKELAMRFSRLKSPLQNANPDIKSPLQNLNSEKTSEIEGQPEKRSAFQDLTPEDRSTEKGEAEKRSALQNPKPEEISDERSDDLSGFGDEELEKILGADLSTRFSALKRQSSNLDQKQEYDLMKPRSISGMYHDEEEEHDDGDAFEGKVREVIEWAKDEARLNPSRLIDDEEEEEEEEGEDEEDDERLKGKKKEPKTRK
ncbi:hypothetical protein AMTRI_Chr09g35940 [Amborella trichopoda]